MSDLVIPVPDSGVPAALGYAEYSKKKFELGLIRNHYVGRTFYRAKSKHQKSWSEIKIKSLKNNS